MYMRPGFITAHMASNIALTDFTSPSLESLVYLGILQMHRPDLVCNNPSHEQVTFSDSVVNEFFPIKRSLIAGYQIPHCSNPAFFVKNHQIHRIRKAWDYQEHQLDWGKKKAKFSVGEGVTKSYDLALAVQEVDYIHWFVNADGDKLIQYLNQFEYLGMKRSCGYGKVLKWTFTPIDIDRSLVFEGKLQATIPYDAAKELLGDVVLLDLICEEVAWRSPRWMAENKTVCVIGSPVINS